MSNGGKFSSFPFFCDDWSSSAAIQLRSLPSPPIDSVLSSSEKIFNRELRNDNNIKLNQYINDKKLNRWFNWELTKYLQTAFSKRDKNNDQLTCHFLLIPLVTNFLFLSEKEYTSLYWLMQSSRLFYYLLKSSSRKHYM